jgi:hypothetical protein
VVYDFKLKRGGEKGERKEDCQSLVHQIIALKRAGEIEKSREETDTRSNL